MRGACKTILLLSVACCVCHRSCPLSDPFSSSRRSTD
eukprot:COSAG01_NODE_37405_length_504_cov_0.592593_1_plen_36_part_10